MAGLGREGTHFPASFWRGRAPPLADFFPKSQPAPFGWAPPLASLPTPAKPGPSGTVLTGEAKSPAAGVVASPLAPTSSLHSSPSPAWAGSGGSGEVPREDPTSQGLTPLAPSIPEEPPRVEADLLWGVFNFDRADPCPAWRPVPGPRSVPVPQRVSERRERAAAGGLGAHPKLLRWKGGA